MRHSRRRAMVWLAGACLLLLVAMFAAVVAVGSHVSAGRTLAILLGLGDASAGQSWEQVVVLHVRLPRVLLAALCGGGLAIAGAAMQGVFRNPMADPGLLGVSSGAAFGAVTALYAGLGTVIAVPAAAFVGALACVATVYRVATSGGRTSVATLILAGLAVSGLASAMASAVLALSVTEWELGRQILAWLMGGLEGRRWTHVALAAPLVLLGALWLLAHARALDVLATGEEAALSVGVDVQRTRRTLLTLISLITAGTVAVVGVVAFVGLVVPHVVRILIGPRHGRLMPSCFVAGALLLVVADSACRSLPGGLLPLGVLTSLVGAPFFLVLVVQGRRKAATL